MKPRCRCQHHTIIRNPQSTSSTVPELPDEIVLKILSYFSPSELIAYSWNGVCRSFGSEIHRILCKSTNFCVAHDPIWRLFRSSGYDLGRVDKLLVLMIKKYWCQVENLAIPVTLFSYLQQLLERYTWLAITSGSDCNARLPQPGVALTHLTNLTIQIGGECGPLTLSHNFDNLKTATLLCNTLREINLNIELSDNEDVTCSGFRELVRFLEEVTCSISTKWNLNLEDNTSCGQGWSGPANLNKYRNKSFVCYVRVLNELSINLNRLTLVDRKKVSPYMLVMSNIKRRSIYMYPEYKRCSTLRVCYDIGLIAPKFSHENDVDESLRQFEVDESHVLYKADLLEYLASAPNLNDMRVFVPASWASRVSRCTKGCFSNPDFACFRQEGWCAVGAKLPKAHFTIIGGCDVSGEVSNVDVQACS